MSKRKIGSNFQRGAGVFCCRMCQRNTRGSPDSASLRLCEECYDYASLENEISDYGDSPELQAQLEALKVRIAALGGDVSRL